MLRYQIVDNSKYLIDVKTSDNAITKNFSHFEQYLENVKSFQLVKNITKEYSNEKGHRICNLINWLANIGDYIK